MFNQIKKEMTRILSDRDRKELLTKYKADRLKDAPANISDKTLIENYGTNEQKSTLSSEPESPAQKGTEIQAGAKTEAGATTEQPNPATDVVEKPIQNDLEGKGMELNKSEAPGDNTAYLDAFNEYVRLSGGKTPQTKMSVDELIAANDAFKNGEREVAKPAPDPAPVYDPALSNAPAPDPEVQKTFQPDPAEEQPEVSGVEMVEVVHKITKERKKVTKFTYEKFMAKNRMPEYALVSVPKEIENLK